MLLLSACSVHLFSAPTDKEYEQLLLGTWISHSSYDNDVIIVYGEKTYNKTGLSDGFISDRMRNGAQYEETNLITHTSRWRVNQGILVISDAVFDPPRAFSEKARYKYKIIKINKKQAVFEDLSNGLRLTRFRKQNDE